jgi:hypothetical protein
VDEPQGSASSTESRSHRRIRIDRRRDPNTGAALFESADIVAYLERTYGTGERA